MDLKELEKIISILKQNDVTEFELEQEGTKIRLTRAGKVIIQQTAEKPAVVQQAEAVGEAAAPAAAPVKEAAGGLPPGMMAIESPIVGTFYRRPSPDADPFVKEGDVVKKGATLCIVEAMKVMNEIDAPYDGRIEKILLNDGQVVEYGEILFWIEPSK